MDNLVAYIGQHSVKQIEQEIMILQGAQLLDVINDQSTTAVSSLSCKGPVDIFQDNNLL